MRSRHWSESDYERMGLSFASPHLRRYVELVDILKDPETPREHMTWRWVPGLSQWEQDPEFVASPDWVSELREEANALWPRIAEEWREWQNNVAWCGIFADQKDFRNAR